MSNAGGVASHSTYDTFPSIARSGYSRRKQDGSDKTRIVDAMDRGLFIRSATEPGGGATTTEHTANQRRRASEADAEPCGWAVESASCSG